MRTKDIVFQSQEAFAQYKKMEINKHVLNYGKNRGVLRKWSELTYDEGKEAMQSTGVALSCRKLCQVASHESFLCEISFPGFHSMVSGRKGAISTALEHGKY